MKNNCTKSQEAGCTFYRNYLPPDSELNKESCVSIADTTEEIYKDLEKLKKDSDLSDLGNSCIEYNPVEREKPTIKEFALKIEEEVCNLKSINKVAESVCNIPLEGCNLELGNLVDQCGEQPQTFGQLLQILINNQNNNNV